MRKYLLCVKIVTELYFTLGTITNSVLLEYLRSHIHNTATNLCNEDETFITID